MFRFGSGQPLSDQGFDRPSIDGPHHLSHRETLFTHADQAAASVIRVRFALDEAAVLQAIEKARKVILRKQQPVFEVTSTKRSAMTLQLEQDVIPLEGRQSFRLQVGLHRLGDAPVTACQPHPDLESWGVCTDRHPENICKYIHIDKGPCKHDYMQMHEESLNWPTLVSHALCPYVQRATIVALEKAIDFDRIVVDLADKPSWFIERSPTGKVPLLIVGETTLFESAAIAEYLDETSGGGMLPPDPVERARHRAWIEFASGTLAEIGGLYSAPDAGTFAAKRRSLTNRFERLAAEVEGPWFGGASFGLADAAFAPVFRYLDVFEREAGLYLLSDLPSLTGWRERLAARASVRAAVASDYPARLRAFLLAKGSHMSGLIATSSEQAGKRAA